MCADPPLGKNARIGPSAGELHRETSWIAIGVAIAIVAAVLLADLIAGRDVVLIGLLGIAPLLCGLTANVRVTRAVAAVAVAVAALAFLWNDNLGRGTYWVPVVVVCYGSVFGLLMASLRLRAGIEAVRLRTLAELGRAAQGGLAPAETARAMAQCLVPAVADLCVIDAVPGGGGLVRLAVEVAGEPELARSFLERAPTGPQASLSSSRAALDGRTVHFPRIDEQVIAGVAGDQDDLELLRALRIESAILMPLSVGGRVYGVLALGTRAPRARFDADAVAFAETIAGRVGLALRNSLLTDELREAEARQQAILSSLDAAILARDASEHVIFANEASSELLKVGHEELLAENPRQTLDRYDVYSEDGRPLELGQFPAVRALQGQEDPPPLIVRNVVRATGEERWLLHKASRVTDEDGSLLMVVSLVEDITTAKRAEVAQRLLAQAGRRVTEARDLTEVLHAVAGAAVPGLADWAAVDLLEGRRIVAAAVAHRDPEMVRLGWRLRQGWPFDMAEAGGVAGVLRSGQAEVVREVPDELLQAAARDPEHLDVLRRVGLHSVMILPVSIGGEVLGALSLVSSSARRFGEEDLELAGDLARLAGIAIEKARFGDEQREIARTLQASLLPRSIESPGGWSVSSAYRAAGSVNEVGGDFYDVVRYDGGWAAIVGDVVGKGAAAAAVTGLVRHTLGSVLEETADPPAALEAVNRRLRGDDVDGLTLCTVAMIAVPDAGPAFVWCAGHPLPLLRRDGAVREVGEPGLLLGYRPRLALSPLQLEIRPADTLLLYTDGATDARGSGGSFGEQRLREALAALDPAREPDVAGAIASRIERFEGAQQFDDIALLALARAPGGG